MQPERTKTESGAPRPRRSPPKHCPRCTLISPSSAERCECGYDFRSGRDEEERANRSETHFYWMGIGGLMLLVSFAMLLGGRISLWLLIGGAVVCVKGFVGWRDARAEKAERDGSGESH